MLLVALAVAAAGCGDKSSEPPGSASAKDPGRDVVGALVDAAAAGDSKAIWALLSRPSKRRLGPTEAAFAKSNELRALRRQLAPFRDGKLPVQISENIDDVFGVVALSRGSNAWAAPIRNEGDLSARRARRTAQDRCLGPAAELTREVLEADRDGDARAEWGRRRLALPRRRHARHEVVRRPAQRDALREHRESARARVCTPAVAFAVANTNAAARAWTFRP